MAQTAQSTNGKTKTFSSGLRGLSTALLGRSTWLRKLGLAFGGRRDYYNSLGYRRQLLFGDFMERYQRQDIARRIIDAYPAATWKFPPIIKENEDSDGKSTRFERRFNEFATRINLWHNFERLDRLARLGWYSSMFIGVAGQTNPKEPMRRITGGLNGVLYLTPFGYSNSRVKTLEAEPTNPEFGKPQLYEVDVLHNLTEGQFGIIDIDKSITAVRRKRRIHSSRMIHVAEGRLEDAIFGIPALQPVFNLLDDLMKVVGGGAETFWINADRGFQANVDKEMELAPEDAEKFSDEIDEYINGLRRWIRTKGIELNAFEATVANPQNAFDVILSLISAGTGIPKRILIGSERGQLASAQDEKNWNSRVRERQRSYAEPVMVRPIIDFLGTYTTLRVPKNYVVEWPDINVLTEEERSTVAMRYGTAVKAVSESGTGATITKQEFRELLGLPKDGAPDDSLLMQKQQPGEVDDPEPTTE